jgi:hypothetical protein
MHARSLRPRVHRAGDRSAGRPSLWALAALLLCASSSTHGEASFIDFFAFNEFKWHSERLKSAIGATGIETTAAYRAAICHGHDVVTIVDNARTASQDESAALDMAGKPELCDNPLPGAFGRHGLYWDRNCLRRDIVSFN